MKHFITLILVNIPFLIFSQDVTEIQVKKSKLSEIKTLNEILTDLPAESKIISFEMSSGNGITGSMITGNDGIIDNKKIYFFKNNIEKSAIYVDLKVKDNKERVISKSYKLKIIQ